VQRQSGASNTEYILIVVMIALAAMFMVKGLGVELRTLFSGATNRLNLFGGNAPEDDFGGPNIPEPGPPPTPTPSPTPPAPQPDHETECRQQQAALQGERETVGAPLSQAYQDARNQYNEAMRQESYWVPGHHSRWGRSSSGHWAYQYVHSAAERQSAQDQLNQARSAYENWNRDWNQRYHQWQADCGH